MPNLPEIQPALQTVPIVQRVLRFTLKKPEDLIQHSKVCDAWSDTVKNYPGNLYRNLVSVIVSPSAPNELHNMCNVVSGVVARHEAIQGSKLGTLDCRASLATTDGETMTEARNFLHEDVYIPDGQTSKEVFFTNPFARAWPSEI